MSWIPLGDLSKRKWKGKHLYRPFRDEVLRAAIMEPGHITEEDIQKGKLGMTFVTIINYDKDELALKVNFSFIDETLAWRKEHPGDLDGELRHTFIVTTPIDGDTAIDTTSD